MISEFTGENAFLSNFYPAKFIYNGILYIAPKLNPAPFEYSSFPPAADVISREIRAPKYARFSGLLSKSDCAITVVDAKRDISDIMNFFIGYIFIN